MEDAPQSLPDALSEGRRIYLGNLPYTAKPYNIEKILANNGFSHLETIHISIDPVNARNPGYCFVDFTDRTIAERALTSLKAEISGRPIKVGPCEPKKHHDRRLNRENDYVFKRWGDWTSQPRDRENTTGRLNKEDIEQGPYGALGHFDNMVENYEGRRLYVGGLGKMLNQAQHNKEITELFAGFNPTAVGKRITPHEHTRSLPGDHHYCFVDFETKDDTDAAMKVLKGRLFNGGRLKIAPARDIPKTLMNRRTNLGCGRREDESYYLRPNKSEYMGESNLSSNWRRMDKE
ncbi:RNA recognition motif domain protein [Penicillium odoratum]|uniref:RNA recognition motif domain protein n=1 Tax=Penicillium odoratum TaxID=1167516 RepID=UPI002548B93F|nr:RNA recognition motif domain protein [Penicillium odoratum]KAJ5778377.1 RNA recognition motif domain protein [Penicillium odoratum]